MCFIQNEHLVKIVLKFNGPRIPDCDAHKIEVQQFPEGAIQGDTPAQLLVRRNGANGELAKIVISSNIEDHCFIDTVLYSVRIHSIHVKLNSVHIPGSPFRIKVGMNVADPAIVDVHGSGLEEIKSGQKPDFIIYPCTAGPGTLADAIDAPS